jgi:hypothetical protein
MRLNHQSLVLLLVYPHAVSMHRDNLNVPNALSIGMWDRIEYLLFFVYDMWKKWLRYVQNNDKGLNFQEMSPVTIYQIPILAFTYHMSI